MTLLANGGESFTGRPGKSKRSREDLARGLGKKLRNFLLDKAGES